MSRRLRRTKGKEQAADDGSSRQQTISDYEKEAGTLMPYGPHRLFHRGSGVKGISSQGRRHKLERRRALRPEAVPAYVACVTDTILKDTGTNNLSLRVQRSHQVNDRFSKNRFERIQQAEKGQH